MNWGKRKVATKRADNSNWLDSLIKSNNCEDAKIEISRIQSGGTSGKKNGYVRRLTEYDFNYSDMDTDSIEEYLTERIGDGNFRVKVFRDDKGKIKYIGQKDFYLGEEEGSDYKHQMFSDIKEVVMLVKEIQGANGNGLHGKIEEAFLAKALNDDPLETYIKISNIIAQRVPPEMKEPDLLTTVINALGPSAGALLAQRLGPIINPGAYPQMAGIQDNGIANHEVRLPGNTPPPLGPSQDQKILSESSQNPKPGFNEAFEKIFLDPIKDVKDYPAEDIAEKIYMMMAYASTIPEEELHPAIKQFVIAIKNEDQQSAINGFKELCAYLGIDDAKAAQIGVLIYEMDALSRQKAEEYEKKLDSTVQEAPQSAVA